MDIFNVLWAQTLVTKFVVEFLNDGSFKIYNDICCWLLLTVLKQAKYKADVDKRLGVR